MVRPGGQFAQFTIWRDHPDEQYSYLWLVPKYLSLESITVISSELYALMEPVEDPPYVMIRNGIDILIARTLPILITNGGRVSPLISSSPTSVASTS